MVVLFRVVGVIFVAALLTAFAAGDARAQFPGEQTKKKAGAEKKPGAEAKVKPAAPLPVGAGCQTSIMTLVEAGGTVGKGCLIGHNQWRFWCMDGSIFDDVRACTKIVPTIQAAEGDGCKTALMVLVQDGEAWGKGCSIGTNLWRFWCANGRVYEETQPYPPPPGGVGQLCNPSQGITVAAAPSPSPGQPGQAPSKPGQGSGQPGQPSGQAIRVERQPVAAVPDQSAVTECLQQILNRNQCQAYLTVKDIRPVNARGQSDDYVMYAEIDMESIQEFEVRSEVAQNCTGTWWNEDPKYTRYQFVFPEAKYFVKVGQLLSVKKVMSFKKNDYGWRCQVQSMKPVEEATVISRPQ